MQNRCALIVGAAALAAPFAHGQIVPVLQERSVQASALVSSGTSDDDAFAAPDFGPFVQTAGAFVAGAAGASANGIASQTSSFSPTLISASLGSQTVVQTGSTFVTGEADGLSTFLLIFNLTEPTPVEFDALGQVALTGLNPEGEPSDLYGRSRVRLINAITEELIAGFQIDNLPGTDFATFDGTLPAGQYAILASAQAHAFSADLLGPPPRSGSGTVGASFTLAVVPGPASGAALVLGVLVAGRRRRWWMHQSCVSVQ